MPLWDDLYSPLSVLDNDLLVGFCGDVVYLFDLNTGQIIWKEVLHKKIYSMTLEPDNAVYITYMNSSVFNYKIIKYNFDITDRSNPRAITKVVTEFEDEDNNERSIPSGMLVVPNAIAGNYDLFISGLNSLYRIKV
jgi:hypothetical protein